MILRLITGVVMGLIASVVFILYILFLALPFAIYEACSEENYIDANFGSGGAWKAN